MDFITGEKFSDAADMLYSPSHRSDEDYCGLLNTFNISKLKPVTIVYTHTGYVKDLFKEIDGLNSEFIILTHNSDINVSSEYYIPLNVRKWLTTNVNASTPILESLPIGLENERWFPDLKKKAKMLSKAQTSKNERNLVYMNHNIHTNLSKRVEPYELLQNKQWVTSRIGANGIAFDDYLDNIYNHKFVICPEGNGMDTHRTWECLYMGTIPIEKRNFNNRFYTDLPICFVDEWSDVTEEFLLKELDRINNTIFDLRKLEFSYWREKIYDLCIS